MEYQTFYEVSNENVDILTFAPIILSLVGFWIFYRTYRENRFLKKEDKDYFSIYLGLVFGIFFCVNSIISIPKSFKKLETTKKVYLSGGFQTLEGEIENFDPMPYSGHKHEKFTLNGIPFEHSDFEGSYYGFQITASHVGPIKRNGQRVRLSYITNEYGRNIILKLELKKVKQ